jgi:hypothetical protein
MKNKRFETCAKLIEILRGRKMTCRQLENISLGTDCNLLNECLPPKIPLNTDEAV